MSLEETDVQRIAHLARIEIAPGDVPGHARNLSEILEFVAQMDAIDTSGVEPMAHPLDAVQRMREDVVTEGDMRAGFQAIAPQVEAGLYLVPRVIE